MDMIRITLASPPDRERLVAEVLVGSLQIAELSRDEESAGAIKLEIYPRPDGSVWVVDADAFIAAIDEARARLQSR